MINSVSATRASMLDTLKKNYPYVTWLDARLPEAAYDATRTLGGVSTIAEIQRESDYFVMRTILIQVFLPINLNTSGNMSLDLIPDASDIEDLATNIINDLAAEESVPDGSWFYRHIRTDYPSDPNGSQTRAAIQFTAYENAADTF